MSDALPHPQPEHDNEAKRATLPSPREFIIGGLIAISEGSVINFLTRDPVLSVLLPILTLVVYAEFGEDAVSKIVATVPHKHRTMMRKRRRAFVSVLVLLLCGMVVVVVKNDVRVAAPHPRAAILHTIAPAHCEAHTFCFLIATLQGPENDDYVKTRLRDTLEVQFDLAHVDVVSATVTGRRAVDAAAVRAGANVAMWGVYTDKNGGGGDVYFEVVSGVREVKKLPFDQPVAPTPIPLTQFNVHIEHTIDAMAYLAHATYGIYLFETGAYADAVVDLTKALSHATPAELARSGAVYFFRGTSRYAEGQASAAADDMQRAIDHQPDPPVTYAVDRGLTLYDAGRYDESFDQFNRVIARYVPTAPLDTACSTLKATGVPEPAYYGLAAGYAHRNQRPQARKALTAALCLDPTDAWAAYALRVLSKTRPPI